MQGFDDLLQEFNPFTQKPRTLAHYRVAAACLERLEDEKGIWREHWQQAGANRKDRRGMLRQLKKHLSKKELTMLRDIITTSRAVKTKNKISATLAAERRADREEMLGS